MSDTGSLDEPLQSPLVAYAFEAVDPALLGMEAESWIPTEQVNLARAILAVTAVDMTKVVLVVTGDMVTSTRERLPPNLRDAFNDERGAGMLGGKTMALGEEVHVLVPSWFYADPEAAAAFLPKTEAAEFRAGTEARVGLARRTIVHEAQHVRMQQHGEAEVQFTDARARRDFLFLAHDVIDEYRAELGVPASLRFPFEYAVAEETLPAFREALKREVQSFERQFDVEALVYGVLAQAQHAWKALANVAAARRVGAAEESVSVGGSDWAELAERYWPQFEGLLKLAPSPSDRFAPEAQRRLTDSLADLFDEWLQGLGFLWHDTDGGRNAEFRIISQQIVS
jgi:hypothetical protein